MIPLDIHIDNDRCYFGPFNRENDFNYATAESGIHVYSWNWYGWLLSLLGWAVDIKDKHGKIHYVNRQDLRQWIQRHDGFTGIANRSFEQAISNICKQQISQEIMHTAKRTYQQIRSQKLKAKAQERVHQFIQILKNKHQERLAYLLELKQPSKSICEQTKTFKIVLGDEVIFANPDRMEKSNYFKHFLHTKENEERFVHVQLDLFEIDETIEIDEETFNIVKLFLEGKTEKDETQEKTKKEINIDEVEVLGEELEELPDTASKIDSAPVPQKKTNELLDGEKDIAHLITPDHFEGLYKFHKIIDISGVLEIAYRTIDFYSDKKLRWQGKDVSAREFWTSLAKQYEDRTLEELCQAKYKSLILVENALNKHKLMCQSSIFSGAYSSSQGCSIKGLLNTDDSVSIVFNIKYDINYHRDWSPNYYTHLFSLDALELDVETMHISSIVIDVTQLNSDLNQKDFIREYLSYLLRDINYCLIPPKNSNCDLIIQGGSSNFFYTDDQNSIESNLGELTTKYHQVIFRNFSVDTASIHRYSEPTIPMQTILSSVYTVLNSDHFSIDFTYLLNAQNNCHFSSIFQHSQQPQKHLTIQYSEDMFDLNYFMWVPSSIPVTLIQISEKKEPWKAQNLSKLKTEQLTFENMILDKKFSTQFKEKKNSLKSVSLKNCEIDSQDQAEITQQLSIYLGKPTDQDYYSVQQIQELIQKNTSRNSCLFDCQINSDQKLNFIIKFAFSLKYYLSYSYKDYYSKQFSIFSSLKDKKNIHFSTITIDVNSLLKSIKETEDAYNFNIDQEFLNSKNYLCKLINNIQSHFDVPNSSNTNVLFNGTETLFNELLSIIYNQATIDESTATIIQSLQALMQTYRSVSLGTIDQVDQKVLNALTQLFKMNGFALEISYSRETRLLSLALKKSEITQTILKIEYDNRAPINCCVYKWVQDPISLTFCAKSSPPHKLEWKNTNLSQLQVKNLTIENAILTEEFAAQLAYGKGGDQLENLTLLTFKNCEMSNYIQEKIDESFIWRNAARDLKTEHEREWIIE